MGIFLDLLVLTNYLLLPSAFMQKPGYPFTVRKLHTWTSLSRTSCLISSFSYEAFPRLEYLNIICPSRIVSKLWERSTCTNIGHMSASPPTVGKCDRSQRNFWWRTDSSVRSHFSLRVEKLKNNACEGSLTIVKHTSRDFVICPLTFSRRTFFSNFSTPCI